MTIRSRLDRLEKLSPNRQGPDISHVFLDKDWHVMPNARQPQLAPWVGKPWSELNEAIGHRPVKLYIGIDPAWF